ncbi:MAG: SagB/ThcOx family dehydrogenase [Elusimicrobiales bacterium]|nr:SagB/ThcOx family dehydrogenase [Elusimicrobiales bacterium]
MEIKLPKVEFSKKTLDEAIYNRKSIRSYKKDEYISLDIFSKFLWASYGKSSSGRKTVPSAGAIYPMKIYVVVGNVKGLEQGIYEYDEENHSVKLLKKGDFRSDLAISSYKQMFVADSSFIIIVSANYFKITLRYGERGYRYTYMEAGHIGQNIHLIASSLELGTVMIGAFDGDKVKKILDIENEVLYIIPVGIPKNVK